MADNRNDTTIGDVLKDHFGISDFQRRREMKNDSFEQERIDQMYVDLGNIPPSEARRTQAQAQTQTPPNPVVPVPNIPHESTMDNKCPSCGGTLSYDPSTGGLICNFCGNKVDIQTMPAAPGLGYSLKELQNNVGRRLQSAAKKVVCGTCGGAFLAESSSISGLCPYCGSNSITVAGDATGTLEPTGVIPFKIGKEQAQAMFKQWIKGRRLSPMDIAKNSEITDLVGVYVPYWVFDCDTYTPYNGKFGRTYGSGDDQYTKYHKSSGVCKMPVRNLTMVASSRLEHDSFWKAVSKFDLNMMKRYDPNLLAGFWSESYTVDGPTTWQNAMGRIYDMIKREIKSMEAADVISKIDMQPQATNIRAKYVLAPIWITSFDYHGTAYRVLINGQTGNIVGTWPKSFKRFFMIFGIIAGAIFGTQFLMALINTIVGWLSGR